MSPATLDDDSRRQRIAALYERSKGHFPEVDDITPEELLELAAAGEAPLIVDCRTPEEQAVSMIEGAIPAAELEADPPDPDSTTVVTYCTIGHRSGLYARRLQARGWRVRNLAGSILSWTHADGPLVDADGPTRRVHVAGPKWSLEASGYDPVW